ncbi:MAG: phosphonoacetate hydrolase [Candidatus Rokuibacteriota bacterium]|nr:MAG: phosphonoacetate hydrolase [Candidatus Rokubacteria bacterium]
MDRPGVSLNGVTYRWPTHPVVVVCIDGGDPAYFEQGVRDGVVPHVARFVKQGFGAVADGDMPSFTCPNNMSIATGAPPAIHGISGNFYLDRATGEAVVMTGPELLRSRTLMAEFSRRGARVVSITAKDKLRRQLGKDMDLTGGSVNFSSECADQTSLAEHGIADVLAFVGRPKPDIYSPELSLFVLEAGVKLLAERRPDILYLSLTDYIQHKYAPGEPEANRYYASLDALFGRLDALGAVVALTADHGMSDKSNADGSPRVIWLQDVLDRALGKATSTVICPITDRFVAHHGALGGFVRVYCSRGQDVGDVMRVAEGLDGVAAVFDRETAALTFDLPLDREGDVVVIGRADTCLGAAAADHDLSGLRGHRLRTHGALAEARVPFILNRPLTSVYAKRAATRTLRSRELFDFAINGVDA